MRVRCWFRWCSSTTSSLLSQVYERPTSHRMESPKTFRCKSGCETDIQQAFLVGFRASIAVHALESGSILHRPHATQSTGIFWTSSNDSGYSSSLHHTFQVGFQTSIDHVSKSRASLPFRAIAFIWPTQHHTRLPTSTNPASEP